MTLHLLDLTLATPALNLALDEALLLECDQGKGVETLRFWESTSYFVTLGVSSRHQADVDVAACTRDGVPILRRASGGGTVLQGPGCLNYALVLRLAERPELADLTRGYALILGRVATALGAGETAEVAPLGTSDLAREGWKFSGNAQKRTRNALLHHGTILHNFDIPLLARYLREPEKQPPYRERRTHDQFVRNLPLSPDEIRRRLTLEWNAIRAASSAPVPDLSDLLASRYANPAWHERF